VTPEQWHALTPAQQAWHHQQWQMQARHQPPPGYQPYPQPAATRPATNVAAIISLPCGLLAFLVLPIVLGPAAIITGVVGHTIAIKTDASGGKMSLLGLLLGVIATLVLVARLGM
jgi:hypothetical protein